MTQANCAVTSIETVGKEIYVIGIHSPEISSSAQPGQFINIKVSECYPPLLRRPFSVYHISGSEVKIIFNVVGSGTRILANKRVGETLDVMGPLGRPYKVEDDYETAILVGGGLGVAPLPMVTAAIRSEKNIQTFLGSRAGSQIVRTHLENVQVATDDGSEGFCGTVIDLLRHHLGKESYSKPKIFGCGPIAMLRNLDRMAQELGIPCEVSLESVMGCGIGICQGCPVERINTTTKYSLVCKEGPVFHSRTIRLSEW